MRIANTIRPALVAGLLVLAACARTAPSAPFLELTGETMGPTYTVRISTPEAVAMEEAARTALAAGIQAELDFVNERMSTWRDDSELSRFNQHASTDPFPVSPEMLHVLTAAMQVSAETGGAFDITVGPLVNAWGFGPNAPLAPPSDDALAALRAHIGYEKLEVDATAGTVRKTDPAVYCDLSAIAKGYGSDRVADFLDTRGYHYMVEVGGEVRVRGINHRGEPWRIGIVNPDNHGRPTSGVVPLNDTAMATSGDYRNFRTRPDGTRYSHTIDPRTGRPIENALASVTVVHPSCMMADAYATALMVLGPDDAYAWAAQRELAVHLILHDGAAFTARSTPAFDALFG